MSIKHWWNRHFGKRRYFVEDGKDYIQEGTNPPEELLEHMRKYHPKEYADLQKELKRC